MLNYQRVVFWHRWTSKLSIDGQPTTMLSSKRGKTEETHTEEHRTTELSCWWFLTPFMVFALLQHDNIVQYFIQNWDHHRISNSGETRGRIFKSTGRCCQYLLIFNLPIMKFSSWWFQPLWKIWKSDWIIIPAIGENKSHVPNHQPVIKQRSDETNISVNYNNSLTWNKVIWG